MIAKEEQSQETPSPWEGYYIWLLGQTTLFPICRIREIPVSQEHSVKMNDGATTQMNMWKPLL